ncbi:MAG: terpene cyclase/mutase family protein [Lentisphaerales bacterium]|nr:terpene cyclase/mutase family protein [Lentisphaerales bacterium]
MRLMIALFVAAFFSLNSMANTGLDNSITLEAKSSVDKAVKYLISKQNDNGSWGPYGGLPAISALAATSIATSAEASKYTKELKKVEKYLLTFAQADGAIWEPGDKGYPNYTTSLATVALYVIDKDANKDVILKARRWMKKSQFTADSGATPEEFGGIGYGSTKTKSDLSNTQMALEALFVTQDLEIEHASAEEMKETKAVWKRAETFLNRCQALPSSNDLAWAKTASGEDVGGFIYSPDRTKVEGEGDALRTYASMTYAGLKSMIYAGYVSEDKLIKDDPRVQAAISWAGKHYTLDENPGMQLQGHFYYINTFAKALDAYGEDFITDKDGKKRMWRRDVVKKLLSLQAADGHWVNSEGRWMENVPEMVTAYSLMSMNHALSKQ